MKFEREKYLGKMNENNNYMFKKQESEISKKKKNKMTAKENFVLLYKLK